jgi:hypothetical protein
LSSPNRAWRIHGAQWTRESSLIDNRVRKVLENVRRHLATLARCYRTTDPAILDDLEAFAAARRFHTFPLDSRSQIGDAEVLLTGPAPMTPSARDLLGALRSYLEHLQNVIVLEPPSFALVPRRLDVRWVAFLPEVRAFDERIARTIRDG